MHLPVIFREYDIRGIYNKDYDDKFAGQLGRAFVVYMDKHRGVKNPKITLGHDARFSCPAIIKSLAKGLVESGAHVVHLGMITSPMSYFSTFTMAGVDGAIMVTGSHNPPEYNGFKISAGKATIFGEQIQILKQIIDSGHVINAKGSEENFDIFPSYLERYKNEFGILKNIKVVLDCGNGAAGVVVRKLFNSCGLEPIILFESPDGNFPNHHPDPTVEHNLVSLKERVLKEKAICGIGFDGDADRIGVVDQAGKMIFGDELIAFFARSVLKNNKGAKIVGDVKCSDSLYKDIADHGGIPVMWKSGHSLVKEKIKETSAPFGGELSGHIFFADRNYGYDDAPYAALRLCEILAHSNMTISEHLSGLTKTFSTPEIRIDTTEEKKLLIVEKMRAAFPVNLNGDFKVNLIDGIRISFADGWALCRASNTQPVLVLRYESTTQAGLNKIQSQIESIVKKYL